MAFKVRTEFSNRLSENINKIKNQINDTHATYVFEDRTISINNPNITCITATMVGGGGAGGSGVIHNGIFYCGGGGGAGGAVINKPFIIMNPEKKKLIIKCQIGKGGSGEVTGGETILTILLDDTVIHKQICHGGKNGKSTNKDNNGGEGAGASSNDMFKGKNGVQGTISLSSVGNMNGGRGGSSAFEEGGLGGYEINQFMPDHADGYEYKNNETNPQGYDGVFGSGGGGSVPGLNTPGGKGGDGFIIIQM